mmetsp:Transcript_13211/g.25292  ORF Transcript_13211/g.25292 Transcript_13211/m.25292 type:complete len:266 (+) Transcript_13211:439-1236(+)
MGADHGMKTCGEQVLRLLVFDGGLGVVETSARNCRRIERNSRSVHGAEVVKKAAEFGREAIVSAIRTREHGVIADRGHLNSVQDGAKAGLSHVRVVRMPGLAKVGWCASLAHDLDHVGMRVEAFDDRVTIDFSEAFCQSDLLVWAQFLASEKYHSKQKEGAPNFLNDVLAERLGEVDSRNFGSKRCSNRSCCNAPEHCGVGGQADSNLRDGKVHIFRKGKREILGLLCIMRRRRRRQFRRLHGRETALHDPEIPWKKFLGFVVNE